VKTVRIPVALEGMNLRRRIAEEEDVLRGFARDGMRVKERQGFTWVLEPGPSEREHPRSFRSELARVVRIVRDVERRRLGESPEATVRAMRERGRRSGVTRGPLGRARLRRAIRWVDALMRGRPNCYRRTLLELALDAGAARETLLLGLDVGKTGHIAFRGLEERTFDVVYELGPD